MPVAVVSGPIAVKPSSPATKPQVPQTRPHFLDFPYAYGLGSQGFQSGQGAVNTTLSAPAYPGDQTITVTAATNIAAGMVLTIYTPVSFPQSFPITFQNVIVTSVAGSTVTLASKIGTGLGQPGWPSPMFPAGSAVVTTWANDTHIGNWYSLSQFLLNARMHLTTGGATLLSSAVGEFSSWSAGTTSVPDGWSVVGSATFVRTQYSAASNPANARDNAAGASQFGVQVTSHAVNDGMDVSMPIPVVAGQRLVLLGLTRIAQTGVNATATLQVADTTNKRSVSDGVTNSTVTVTSATAAFTKADEGASIAGAGIPLGATILLVENATTIILSAAATASASGVTLTIGPRVIASKTFGDPQASVQVNAYNALAPTSVAFTVPQGCTSISVGLRIPTSGNSSLLSDLRLLPARQDTIQRLPVLGDPGPYGIAVLGDSWGRGMVDSGGFAAACQARFGRSITIVDSCHTGDTLATMLTRLDAILGASPQRTVTDAAWSTDGSGKITVTSATAAFTTQDLGASVTGFIATAGTSGQQPGTALAPPLTTTPTIIAVNSATSVTLSAISTINLAGYTNLQVTVGSGQPPSYLIHASTFENDSGSSQSQLQGMVQILMTKCRDHGVIPVILGAGNRNTLLAQYMQLNEAIRSQVDSEIGSLILTDANVAALSG